MKQQLPALKNSLLLLALLLAGGAALHAQSGTPAPAATITAAADESSYDVSDETLRALRTERAKIAPALGPFEFSRVSATRLPRLIWRTTTAKAGADTAAIEEEAVEQFTAALLNRGIELNWSARNGWIRGGFSLYRMLEGEAWEEIGYIDPMGGAIARTSYRFTDNVTSLDRSHRIVYYRLGYFNSKHLRAWSRPAFVLFDQGELVPLPALSLVCPNPLRGGGTVSFSLPADDDITISILDYNGNEMKNIVHTKSFEAGPHSLAIDTDGLAAGMYMLALHTKDRSIRRVVAVAGK